MNINFDDFTEYNEKKETPDYQFLLNLYTFINEKSYPKKNTRKFLKKAYELVKNNEIDKDIFEYFIKNEKLPENIVKNMLPKLNKSNNKSNNKLSNNNSNNNYFDPCTRPIHRSSC